MYIRSKDRTVRAPRGSFCFSVISAHALENYIQRLLCTREGVEMKTQEINAAEYGERYEALLAKTPWIEEKFGAIHKAIIEYGKIVGPYATPRALSTGLRGYELEDIISYIGDQDIKTSGLAVRFETPQRLSRTFIEKDDNNRYVTGHSRVALGGFSGELTGLLTQNLHPRVLLTNSHEGHLFLNRVATNVYKGLGELSLGLSKDYMSHNGIQLAANS